MVGITYCDYGQDVLICKPKEEMFKKAMSEAGVKDKSKCYFVDDSFGNHLISLETGTELQ